METDFCGKSTAEQLMAALGQQQEQYQFIDQLSFHSSGDKNLDKNLDKDAHKTIA